MKTRAIIQARMGSSRLRGKSLIKLSGKTLLERVITNVNGLDFVDEIVVATTILPEDDVIEDLLVDLDVDCFRGHEKNLLNRFYNASSNLNALDTIVRITADNPFLVSSVASSIYHIHKKNSYDYTCVNNLSHVAPEFIKVKALRSLNNKKYLSRHEKEHVTPYFRKHIKEFDVRILSDNFGSLLSKYDKYLTIDTSDDLLRIKNIIVELDIDKNFDIMEIYKYLENTYEKK